VSVYVFVLILCRGL